MDRLKLAIVVAPVVMVAVAAAFLAPYSSSIGPQENTQQPDPAPAGSGDAGHLDTPPSGPVEPAPAGQPAPAEPAAPPNQYARAHHDWYEMDVPAGWVLPPENPLLGAAADMLFAEVSGGEVERFVPHTYIEPGSVFEVIPTSLDVRATPTTLSLEEFAALESEVMGMIGELFGIDVRQSGSTPAMLGSNPGLVSEYRVDAGQSAVFTVGVAITVVDGVAYTISYTAADGVYQDGVRHLERAAGSFVAIPSGLPAYLREPATEGGHLQVLPDLPRPDVSARPGIAAGTVTKVVDGDTIDISGVRYRFNLVDTPERGEPGFAEATAEVEILCPVGSTVYYDDDDITPFDRYGRHLGVVWCGGNGYLVSVGEHLWMAGLAEFYYQFCGTSEAATTQWAATHGGFYREMCGG